MAKAIIILLGFAVGALTITAVVITEAAGSARDDARAAAAKVSGMSSSDGMAGMDMAGMNMGSSSGAGKDALTSYAGTAPANADDLAMAHTPYPAALPPVPAGPVANVHMTLKDVTISIAPGIKYAAWGFDAGAPGPVVHVREGQTVHMTLTNGGAIPHSIDFHAARIAPNKAFRDVNPGDSFSFDFKATDPGVFMYHCGTKPVLAHIANGMYGAIVVDPSTPLPHADNEYVLVASEWYLNGPGTSEPASFSMDKAHAMMPDWMTFNGYAGQYVKHPLTADPGDVTRFYVVDAGPSLDTDFHVVGTMFDRAWVNSDVTDAPQHGVQTVTVPAGGGGIFDVKIPEEGLYPFVSHSFASVDLGQVGVLKVGNPTGTMSH
jgi:nitrite reductase (NO-forming)